MAMRILLLVAVLILCIVQVSSDANKAEDHQAGIIRGANRRLFKFMDCATLCQDRCKLHSRPNLCHRACGTCCARCKCVPPGTSGNREFCGACYTDMTTHGNRSKCP